MLRSTWYLIPFIVPSSVLAILNPSVLRVYFISLVGWDRRWARNRRYVTVFCVIATHVWRLVYLNSTLSSCVNSLTCCTVVCLPSVSSSSNSAVDVTTNGTEPDEPGAEYWKIQSKSSQVACKLIRVQNWRKKKRQEVRALAMEVLFPECWKLIDCLIELSCTARCHMVESRGFVFAAYDPT